MDGSTAVNAPLAGSSKRTGQTEVDFALRSLGIMPIVAGMAVPACDL